MLTTAYSRGLAPGNGAGGFSLIELLTALTLLGILLGLGLPSFSLWIRNSQIRTVAESLQDGLRTAQAEAVRRNQSVVISFTNDSNPQIDPTSVVNGRNWSIQTIPSAFIDPNPAFVRAGALADVASNIAISGPGTAAVCFNGNGRLIANAAPTASTATCAIPVLPPRVTFDVTHPNSDRPLRVTVSVGGQVRMCDPARTLSSTTPDGCP